MREKASQVKCGQWVNVAKVASGLIWTIGIACIRCRAG
jgi:hypothetical protein